MRCRTASPSPLGFAFDMEGAQPLYVSREVFLTALAASRAAGGGDRACLVVFRRSRQRIEHESESKLGWRPRSGASQRRTEPRSMPMRTPWAGSRIGHFIAAGDGVMAIRTHGDQLRGVETRERPYIVMRSVSGLRAQRQAPDHSDLMYGRHPVHNTGCRFCRSCSGAAADRRRSQLKSCAAGRWGWSPAGRRARPTVSFRRRGPASPSIDDRRDARRGRLRSRPPITARRNRQRGHCCSTR